MEFKTQLNSPLFYLFVIVCQESSNALLKPEKSQSSGLTKNVALIQIKLHFAVLHFWRRVDATPGGRKGRSENLWNADDVSDGCFVEFSVTCRNAE
jgi:hypothetical protein